jgi:trigger factor
MNQTNWERVLREEDSSGLPGFDAALVGLESGESHAFDLTYPEDSDRWAGETAHFQVTLHGVKAKELPALDDDFAQTVGSQQTLDELREAIRENLRAQREAEADYQGKVLEKLVEQATINYPPFLLEKELDGLLEDHDELLRRQGMPLDDFLRMTGKTREEYREENRSKAKERLERSLALSEFVEREGLEVQPDDVESAIEQRVAQQPEESAERLRSLLDSPGGRRALGNDLLTQQALLRLEAIARGEYTEPAAEADTEDPIGADDVVNDTEE